MNDTTEKQMTPGQAAYEATGTFPRWHNLSPFGQEMWNRVAQSVLSSSPTLKKYEDALRDMHKSVLLLRQELEGKGAWWPQMVPTCKWVDEKLKQHAARLAKQEPYKPCPYCGHLDEIARTHCSRCGSEHKEQEAPEQGDAK